MVEKISTRKLQMNRVEVRDCNERLSDFYMPELTALFTFQLLHSTNESRSLNSRRPIKRFTCSVRNQGADLLHVTVA